MEQSSENHAVKRYAAVYIAANQPGSGGMACWSDSPVSFSDDVLGRRVLHSESDDIVLSRAVADDDVGVTVSLAGLQAKAGDIVWVAIDGARKPEVALTDVEVAAQSVEVTLSPADRGGEGAHQIVPGIRYATGNGSERIGTPQTFVIKTAAPGGTSLPGMVFPDVHDPIVAIDALRTDEAGMRYLMARIERYEGMAEGDEIFGIIDDEIEAIDSLVDDSGIELRFGENFIRRQGDGDTVFSYRVVDRAYNASVVSSPVTLDTFLEDAFESLAAPVFPAFDREEETLVIDEPGARGGGHGLEVVIPADSEMEPGDQIFVKWGDSAEVGPVTVVAPTSDTIVGVPYAPIHDAWLAAGGGDVDAPVRVDISYRVARGGLTVGRSDEARAMEVRLAAVLPVEVDDSVRLSPPIVRAAVGNYSPRPDRLLIAPSHFSAAPAVVEVEVPVYPNQAAGDRIEVQVNAAGGFGYEAHVDECFEESRLEGRGCAATVDVTTDSTPTIVPLDLSGALHGAGSTGLGPEDGAALHLHVSYVVASGGELKMSSDAIIDIDAR